MGLQGQGQDCDRALGQLGALRGCEHMEPTTHLRLHPCVFQASLPWPDTTGHGCPPRTTLPNLPLYCGALCNLLPTTQPGQAPRPWTGPAPGSPPPTGPGRLL